MMDADDRKRFDGELYSPESVQADQMRFLAAINAGGDD